MFGRMPTDTKLKRIIELLVSLQQFNLLLHKKGILHVERNSDQYLKATRENLTLSLFGNV